MNKLSHKIDNVIFNVYRICPQTCSGHWPSAESSWSQCNVSYGTNGEQFQTRLVLTKEYCIIGLLAI